MRPLRSLRPVPPQVIEGGNYDVDIVLKSPSGAVIYQDQKKQYESHEWMAEQTGEYRFCFSNEFSTFTHKIVYFDLQVGEEGLLRLGSESPLSAMTQVRSRERPAFKFAGNVESS